MIQITADTRRAAVTNKELLTKGSAGIQVQFTLSEDWAGLSKVAVFRQGDDGERVDCVLDSGLTCVVPPEVLTTDDEVVFCGVYGSNGQGTIIIPTIWASLGVVRPGTEPNTPASAEPTPEIWAQILNVAQSAEGTANEAYTMAANAQGYIVEKIVTDAVDDFVENTVPAAIQEVVEEGTAQVNRIGQAVVDVQAAVDQAESDAAEIIADTQTSINTLEAQKNTIAQSVASMAELGTDTTLSTSGMAADAKATGDAISDLTRQLSDVEENQIPELKSALKSYDDSEIECFVDGNLHLPSGFLVNGNISGAGNPTINNTTYKYRVFYNKPFIFSFPVVLELPLGYVYRIFLYSAAEMSSSTKTSDTIINDTVTSRVYTVSANQYFSLLINRHPTDTADTFTPADASKIITIRTIFSEQKESVQELYDDMLSLDAKGEIPIKGDWSLGSMSSGGNLYVGDNYKTRVISLTAMRFDVELNLHINSGYKVRIAYYSSNEMHFGGGDNPSFISITDWLTTSCVIPANTWFDIMIAELTDPETADLNTFVSAIYLESKIYERLNALDGSLPTYWKTYLDTKYPTLIDKDALIGSGGDSFVFITDVHYARNIKNSPALIHNIVKNTAVKTVFNGGDTLDEGDTTAVALDKLTAWQSMMYGLRCFNIVGNHDNNNYNSSNPSGKLTLGQFYGIMTKPAEEWINTDGKIYYCVDNESQKIRYICAAIDGFTTMTGTQKTWFQQKLTELDSTWTVVVLQHRIWGSTTESIAEKAQAVINAINEVWANINAKFIGIIAGHTHTDYSTTESVNGYLLIACNCDTMSGSNSGYTRTAGTTSEQSFDVFYIDKTNTKLYAVRIGAGDTSVGSGTGIREWSY